MWQKIKKFKTDSFFFYKTDNDYGKMLKYRSISNFNSSAVPESSSLYPSFTESSQYSPFKNGRMSCRKLNCSARSQLYTLTWDITDCVYQNTCQNGHFNNFVYVSVRWDGIWIAPLSLSLCSLPVLSVCGSGRARVPKYVQMIHFTLWWLNLSVNPWITCVPNRGDWSVRITDHLRSVSPLTKHIH